MLTSSTQNGVNNFIKCHKAVQLLCSVSAPFVDDVLKNWHRNQNIPACSRPRPVPPSNPQECPDRGKPKAAKSCKNCVDWGNAVEAVYYPPWNKKAIQWGNVNPVCLSRSHMDVARAFVLRLPTKQVFNQAGNLDTASLLMIMMHFGEFHGNDKITFDIFKRVFDIRNTLAHLRIEDNMTISDVQIQAYFHDMQELVKCMVLLKHFSQAFGDYIEAELQDILQSPVREATKKDVLRPFTEEMEKTITETIERQYRDHAKELTEHLETVIRNVVTESVDQMTETLGAKLDEGITEVKGCQQGVMIWSEQQQEYNNLSQEITKGEKPPFDVNRCKEQLRLEYRTTRGTVPLLPGMPEEFRDMDKLYVDLEIEVSDESPFNPIQPECRRLKSQQELLDLKGENGRTVKRVLVKGGPGCGKSTLVSKLAYDYANGHTSSNYELFIVLDLKEIRKGMDLVDAIQDQLLPKIGRKGLMDYITKHAESVVFLLDGYDEASQAVQTGEFKHLLSNKWLQESLVIVTTRPHKLATFFQSFGKCAVVNIMKFSFHRVCEFVVRYYHLLPYIGCIGQKVMGFCDHGWANSQKEYIPIEAIRKIQNSLANAFKQISSYIQRNSQERREIAECLVPLIPTGLMENKDKVMSEELQALTHFLTEIWNVYGPPLEYKKLTKTIASNLCQILKAPCYPSGNGQDSPLERLEYAITFMKSKSALTDHAYREKEDQIRSCLNELSRLIYKPHQDVLAILEEIIPTLDEVGEFRNRWMDLQKQAIQLSSLLELCISHWNHPVKEVRQFTPGAEMFSEIFHKTFGNPRVVSDLTARTNSFMGTTLNLFQKWTELSARLATMNNSLTRSLRVDLENSFEELSQMEKSQSGRITFLQGLEQYWDVDQLLSEAVRVLTLIGKFENIFLKKQNEMHSKATKILELIDCNSGVSQETNEMYSNISSTMTRFLDHCESRVPPKDIDDSLHLLRTFIKSCGIDESKQHIYSRIDNIVELLYRLKSSQVEQLAEIPCLLTMLCLLWDEEQQLPDTMTEVYRMSLGFLSRHWAWKTQVEVDMDRIDKDTDALTVKVGKLALKALLEDNLVFHSHEFDSGVLMQGCEMGILSKERKRSKLRLVDFVTFVHKTFQEFSAARYLAHLTKSNLQQCRDVIMQVTTANIRQMGLFLQFCCGLCHQTADIIFSSLADVFMEAVVEEHRDKISDWEGNMKGFIPFFHPPSSPTISHSVTRIEDQTYFPLLWFQEAKAPNLIKYLCAILRSSILVINPFDTTAIMDSLDTLSDMFLATPEKNVFKAVESVVLTLQQDSGTTTKAQSTIAKLLRCTVNAHTLIICSTADSKRCISDSTGAIAESISQMSKLRTLTLHGQSSVRGLLEDNTDFHGTFRGILNSLNKMECITYLTSVSVCVPYMSTVELGKLLKRQTTLSDLFIFLGYVGEHPNTEIYHHTFRKRPTTPDKLLTPQAYDPIFNGCDTKVILECLKSRSLRTLSLRSSEIPVPPLIPLLTILEVLDLKCNSPFTNYGERPFQTGEFGDAVVTVGRQIQLNDVVEDDDDAKDKKEFVLTGLPLSVLQLDNGKISKSATIKLVKAFPFLPNLQRLSFGPNSLTASTIIDVAESLRYLLCLKSLDLGANEIGPAMTDVSRGLKHLTNLEELDLQDTNLDDEGLTMIPFECLQKLARLYVDDSESYGPQGVINLLERVSISAFKLSSLYVSYKPEWKDLIFDKSLLLWFVFCICKPNAVSIPDTEPGRMSLALCETDLDVLRRGSQFGMLELPNV